MTTRQSTHGGFTIIELVIVIAVIGILATLAFVSYGTVEQNARSNAALSNAKVMQQKLEAYLSLKNSYPQAHNSNAYMALLDAYPDTSLASTPIIIGDPDETNGTTTIEISRCASGNDGDHYRIRYWDFSQHQLSDSDLEGSVGTQSCPAWTPVN